MKRGNDNYGFVTKSEVEYLDELNAIRQNSVWRKDIPAESMALKHIQPIDAYMLGQRYHIDEDVLSDTADDDGTKLLLQFGNGLEKNTVPLGDTGYFGLFQTAVGLQGSGIGRLWKRSRDLFVDSINEFLKSNGSKLTIYDCCGKARGVFSQSYSIMEIDDCVEIAKNAFMDTMGLPEFEKGEISHAITACNWILPDIQADFAKVYKDVATGISGNAADLMPSVKFVSSNTGNASAMLLPQVARKGAEPFPIGYGVRIRHDNRKIGSRTTGCGMKDFEAQAKDLLPRFMESAEVLKSMQATYIENTENAFIAACNWAFRNNLPRKLCSNCLDEFRTMTGGDPCTFYDIFSAICGVTTEAKKANVSLMRETAIEDSISRFYGYRGDWSDFDIAGVVAWNGDNN